MAGNSTGRFTGRFRILSLDGGGARGVFTAAVLTRLAERTGKENLADYFDLITGTSTGGIIAIGLGLGMRPADILSLYEQHAEEIFPPATGWFQQRVAFGRHLMKARYDQSVLERLIKDRFGEQPLRNSSTRLVIPAYNAEAGNVHLFKTPHSAEPEFARFADLPAYQVATATAAAPTYFNAYTIDNVGTYVDGGVWANCPAMAGVVEAVHFLHKPLDHIHIWSIGTTYKPAVVSAEAKTGGLWAWRTEAVAVLMNAQVAGTVGTVNLLLGPTRFRRTNLRSELQDLRMDDPTQVPALKRDGFSVAEREWQDIDSQFLDVPAERYTPSY